MKQKNLRLAAFAGVVLLAVIYFVTVALSVDHPGIDLQFSHFFKLKAVDFAVSAVFALSVIWFLNAPDGANRWLKLIPAAAVQVFFYIYSCNLSIIPNSRGEWSIVDNGIFLFLFLICAGFLLNRAVINTRQRAPKWKPVLQTAGALILFAFALNENIFREILACVLLLPALFLTVAKMIRRAEEKYPKFAPFGTFTYFACTLVVILAFCKDLRFYDPTRPAFLVAATVFALWSTQKDGFGRWFFGWKGRKFYALPWLWAALMSAGFFFTNLRITTEILPSWNLPDVPTAINGLSDAQNWFSYRWVVLKDNLSGSFENFRPSHLLQIPGNDNLAWIRHVYGIFAALGVLLLIGVTFFLLYKCVGNNDLRRYLFAVLAVRTVIGLAANFLLVFSTDMTPLMLGSMYDIAFVLGILLIKDKQG